MIWYHEIKDVFKVKQNNETYEERPIFLKKIQIVLLVCSTEKANFWETVLIIPGNRYSFLVLRLLFVTKEKTFPPAKFPIPSTGGNSPYTLTLF